MKTPKPLTVWNTINWKILKEMGMPDHLYCLLRNLYAGQEATVRTGHGTTDWLQVGKGVRQGCILSSCLFNLYAECIMRNAGLEEAQAGINPPMGFSRQEYWSGLLFPSPGDLPDPGIKPMSPALQTNSLPLSH